MSENFIQILRDDTADTFIQILRDDKADTWTLDAEDLDSVHHLWLQCMIKFHQMFKYFKQLIFENHNFDHGKGYIFPNFS